MPIDIKPVGAPERWMPPRAVRRSLKAFRGVKVSGLRHGPDMANDLFPYLEQPTCAQCAGIGLTVIPRLLWEMEDECGEAVLFAFLRAHGGRELNVPVFEPQPDETDVIGLAVQWLHRTIGCGRMVVPLGPISYQARLGWTIYRRLAAGASLSAIARDLQCDTRSVGMQKRRLFQIGALPVRPRALPKP